jgi:hypothetical protein
MYCDFPQLVSGATSNVNLTAGQAASLPSVTNYVSSTTAPPFNWMPVLLVGGGLLFVALFMRKRSRERDK